MNEKAVRSRRRSATPSGAVIICFTISVLGRVVVSEENDEAAVESSVEELADVNTDD